MLRIPRTKKGLAFYLVAIAIASFSILTTSNTPTPKRVAKAPSPIPNSAVLGASEDTAFVERIIDGDTFEISGGKKVRMIGIDTPETVAPRKPVECFGKEAAEYAKATLLHKHIKLVKDVSETDSFGRLLRYVYIDNQFINRTFVEEGFAQAVTFPPDIAKQNDLKKAEQNARLSRKGLWGETCKITR